MSKVTKESLAERIQHLEALCSMISLNEEYQLAAYRKLLQLMNSYAELQERYDLDVNPEGK